MVDGERPRQTARVHVGPYELLSEIGSGGAGLVYRARSPEGHDVVVKLLRHEGVLDAADTFEREARLLGRLGDAEGFVPILGAGRHGGRFYIVLPFLPGGTLADRMGKLGADEAVRIVRELARAIGRAHERGIIHRDLKPANILFTAAGEPRIADLGLAKVLGPDPRALSTTGMIAGTPGYMAPEQIEDAKNVSPAADVFALGVILVEAVTGERPFGAAGNMLEYALAFARKPELARLPGGLVPVATRALARDPRARYPDGIALGRALAAPRARRPFAVVAALLALASLGVAAFLAATRSDRPAPEATSDKADRLASDAEACLAAGDTTRAIELATRARDLASKPARALTVRAAALMCGGEPAKAVEDAKRAAALEPTPRTALDWVTRGIVAESANDLQREIKDDTRAIELAPDLAIAWTRRSEARDMKGDDEGALADASRAVELCGRLAIAWLDRATVRCKKGDLDAAIDDATRAIEIAPRMAAPWSVRAAARAKKKDHAGVLADLTQAIALDPGRPGDWANRARAHRALGDPRGGFDDANRAIELDPALAPAWFHRGLCRADLGDLPGAIADLLRVIALDPGLAAAERGDYERILAGAPDGPNARKVRRWLDQHH